MPEVAAQGDRSSTVFIIYGRNHSAARAIFDFVRSLSLRPIEWEQAVAMTGQGSPYPGDVLDLALSKAQAAIVFLTPDEFVALRPEYVENDTDCTTGVQARPNVLFEAGMAMGRYPDRTIIVQLGQHRSFSDIGGRHLIHLENSPEKRNSLVHRLKAAGCVVDTSGNHWMTTGDFTPPVIADILRLASSGTDAPANVATTPDVDEEFTIWAGQAKASGGRSFSIKGRARNNDNVERSASLTATFYDSDGEIVGTATGMIPGTKPGATKTFELLSFENLSNYSHRDIQIDQLYS